MLHIYCAVVEKEKEKKNYLTKLDTYFNLSRGARSKVRIWNSINNLMYYKNIQHGSYWDGLAMKLTYFEIEDLKFEFHQHN